MKPQSKEVTIFPPQRYATAAVSREIPLAVQLFLWQCIDRLGRNYHEIQELSAISHPNHAEGVYIIRNLLRYIINAEHCISSSRRRIHAGAWWDTAPKGLMISTTASWWYAKPAAWINKKGTFGRKSSFFVGGGWWIRTTEVSDNRFTVCPLWPLGKSPIWSWWTESNHQPADYKSAALPLSHTSNFYPSLSQQ